MNYYFSYNCILDLAFEKITPPIFAIESERELAVHTHQNHISISIKYSC